MYLVTKHPLVLLSARFATGLGAWYTATVLVTGWVRGIWLMGWVWVWDARLTSVLLSFLLLAGSVRFQLHHVDPGPFSLLIGWIDIPFLKSAVHWWNTQHQQGSISRSGSAVHEPMSHALWCLVAFENIACLFLFVLETRVPIPTHTECS